MTTSPPPILTKAQEKHILENLKTPLLAVEQVTGVPWQLLVSVLYRENNLSTDSPKTLGGPWQFDPTPAPKVIAPLLNKYVNLMGRSSTEILQAMDTLVPPLVYKGLWVNEFLPGAIMAACWLRHKSKFYLPSDRSDAAIQDALYGYNGRAYGPSPLRSPYVMSKFNAQYTNMRIRGTLPDGKGGRIKIDKIDARPGAFTVYTYIKAKGL
jgi:hypothetical protein